MDCCYRMGQESFVTTTLVVQWQSAAGRLVLSLCCCNSVWTVMYDIARFISNTANISVVNLTILSEVLEIAAAAFEMVID